MSRKRKLKRGDVIVVGGDNYVFAPPLNDERKCAEGQVPVQCGRAYLKKRGGCTCFIAEERLKGLST